LALVDIFLQFFIMAKHNDSFILKRELALGETILGGRLEFGEWAAI